MRVQQSWPREALSAGVAPSAFNPRAVLERLQQELDGETDVADLERFEHRDDQEPTASAAICRARGSQVVGSRECPPGALGRLWGASRPALLQIALQIRDPEAASAADADRVKLAASFDSVER